MKIFRLGAAPKNGVGFGTTDLEYIQDGISEAVAAIVSAQLPAGYSAPVIMNGCVVTKVGTDYTHTAGQIFYQGFIYTVDELTTSLSSPAGEAKWGLLELPNPVDNPVVFDNGSSYNIDIHLKFRLVASTGSGVVQWDQIRRLEHIQFNRAKELYEIITVAKLETDDFFTNYFDEDGVGLPYNKYEGFEIATGFDKSVDFAGKTLVGINFKDTSLADVRLNSSDVGANNFNTYFKVTGTWADLIGSFIGKWKHLLLGSESGISPNLAIGASGDSSNTSNLQNLLQSGGGAPYDNQLALRNLNTSADNAHNNIQPSVISLIVQKVSEISV